MLYICFIVSCLLCSASSQPPMSIARCLTGYMTDVQSWVDFRGRLTEAAMQRNAIDVSYQLNAIAELRQHMQYFECTNNSSVQYLSLARCQLRMVPRLNWFRDYCGQVLSDTIVYLSLFGNDFNSNDYYVEGGAHRNVSFGNWSFPWSSNLRDKRFPRLKELDLRLCEIQDLDDGIFSGMPNLEKLYLGENNILLISSHTFIGLRRLVHLDISRNCEDVGNGPGALNFQDLYVFAELINLQSLDLSFTKIAQNNVTVFKSLSKSLLKLSICQSGFTKVDNDIFEGTSLRFLEVSGNENFLKHNTILQSVSSTLQAVYADGVALKSLEVFENLTSLEILRISHNEIREIKEYTAMSLRNLQVLIMDSNRLSTWDRPIVSLMPQLKLLSIRNNNINLITGEMAKDFGNLSYIGLSGNFIICNCNFREVYEIALRNEETREKEFIHPINDSEQSNLTNIMYITAYDDVNNMIENRNPVTSNCTNDKCLKDNVLEITGHYLLIDYDQNLYKCLMTTDGKSTSVEAVPSCQTRNEPDIDEVISATWNRLYLLTIPLIILPLLIFGYIYRRNFRYFLITIRNSATLSLIGNNEIIDENTIFNYDVFVSYCNEDRAWVLDQLLPHVEKACNISICLHERDFMVGLSILENIVSCMDRSKTIMLILSQKFLLSQWCQFEMHLAQHRLLETRREDLVLVLLEEIPRRLRPNTLHYLMLTNTYIVWPTDETEQMLFWKRLRKSLVVHKMRHSDNVSLA